MVNSRDDAYASKRDYQQFRDCTAIALTCSEPPENERHMLFGALVDGTTRFLCGGGYLRSDQSRSVRLALLEGDAEIASRDVRVGDYWTRAGIVIEARGPIEVFRFRVSWDGAAPLEVWGLDAGRPQLPERLEALDPSLRELSAGHLVPEGFYLSHTKPWSLELLETTEGLAETPGSNLTEKKCSFDERWMPADINHPGKLAFHAHSDKRTKHQNECRACKKWRINRLLNPIRTTAQLNESAVLTRERKLFLREPAVLERFKEDHGLGLKDHIWEKFGRQCFRCRRALASPSEMDLDHTRPLAYLWPLDEHATCLCPTCNNLKRHQFPVDFYDDQQLARLSEMSGLGLEQLRTKAVNQAELRRILEDLAAFAEEWDARLFRSVHRRVAELTEIDLFEELREQDPDVYAELQTRLSEAPDLPAGETE